MNRRSLEFGKFVLDRRKSLGISQQRLAELLKVHPTYLSKIEQKGFVPQSRVIRLLALCLQADPAELIELSGNESVGVQLWSNSSQLQGLTRDESVFIQNLRLLSTEGKRFMENSLRYVLAGENKNFQVVDDKASTAIPEVEKYKDKSEITENQISDLTNTKLESPLVDTSALKLNRAKPDERFEAAKKEFLEGHKAAAIDKFDDLLSEEASEDTVRKIAAFLFRNDAFSDAKRVLESVPLATPRSKILMSKILIKHSSAVAGVNYLEHVSKDDNENAAIYQLHIAEIWLDAHLPEKSKEVFVSVDPDKVSTPVENMMGAMLGAALGNWKLAELFGEQAVQLSNSKEGAVRLLCSIYLVQGKNEKLAATAAKFKEKYPTDPMGHLFDSISLHLNSKIEDSLISLERAVALDLEYTSLIDNLIEFLIRDGVSPSRLLPLLEKFKSEGTDKYFVVYSEAFKKAGQRDRSFEILNEGKKRYPNSQRIAYEIAANLYMNGRIEDAEAELKPFEDSDKATASTLLMLAKLKQERGNLLSAKEFAEKATLESPDWLPPFITLSEIHSALGQDAKALTVLEEQKKKFKTKGNLNQILVAESDLYTERKLYEQAIPILEKLTAENTKNISYKIKLGFAYVRSGMHEKGAEQFAEARSIDPNRFQASNNLAYAFNMAQNYKGALEILEGLKNRSDLSKNDLCLVHSNLSHSLIKLGKVEEAESAARKAINLDPNWSESYFNLGLCLIKKGDISSAKDSFQKALSLDKEGILLSVVAKLLRKLAH